MGRLLAHAFNQAARLIAERCKGRLGHGLSWRTPTKPKPPPSSKSPQMGLKVPKGAQRPYQLSHIDKA